ncbi:hypothetical protein CO669_26260 [Bradyrhizobium sp. Y36]|nr:hypothetical protein CO669_26260 [Bradyrhizobium sp. Y36]
MGTGSRQENASKQESRAPFRFHRNGKGSSARRAAVFREDHAQAIAAGVGRIVFSATRRASIALRCEP